MSRYKEKSVTIRYEKGDYVVIQDEEGRYDIMRKVPSLGDSGRYINDASEYVDILVKRDPGQAGYGKQANALTYESLFRKYETLIKGLGEISRECDRLQVALEGEGHAMSGDVACVGDMARSVVKEAQGE